MHPDTGLKPYSCPTCIQTFSRQDSLARHLKRHTHTRGTVNDPASTSHGLQTSPTSLPATPERGSYAFQNLANNTDSQLLGHIEQQGQILRSNLNAIENASTSVVSGEASFDPLLQLTWPDSEALLQSLLATDFDALQQSGGMFPSQAAFSNDHQLNSEATSPWIDQENRENDDHSGNQAIRNLTKIITTLVCISSVHAEALLHRDDLCCC